MAQTHKCRFVRWLPAHDARGPHYRLTCLECHKWSSECWYPHYMGIIDMEEAVAKCSSENLKNPGAAS